MGNAVEETTFSLSATPPGQPERRQQLRSLKILRVATLVIDGRRELCLVRNISAGGLMAHAYSPFHEGQRIAVEFKSGYPVPGQISWCEGSNIGIAFDQTIDLEDMLSNQESPDGQKPRLPRVEVDRLATLRTGARILGVNTRDISQGGVKLEIDGDIAPGTNVVLTLDRFRPIEGSVRWCKEGLCGVEFHSPVPFKELMGWLRSE